MKKPLLLLLSILWLAAGALRAAPVAASISGERGLSFRLSLDGRPVTRGAMPQVYLEQLRPGYHWADFSIPVGRGQHLNYRTQFFLADGFETNFVLLARPGFPPSLRTVNTVPLSPPVPVRPIPGAYPRPMYEAPIYSMSPNEVNGLLQAIERQAFDDAKMALMHDALHDVTIEALDARRLIQTLAFDQNRIETAKYLYGRVFDRHNFYQVYDALVFTSSIQEVQRYVQSVR